jgi:hypothetical protein
MRLCRLEQDVALSSNGKLDDTFGREIPKRQDHLLVGSRDVIDAQSAALDLAPCFAVGRDEACLDERRQNAEAGLEFGTRDFYLREIFRDRAFLKRLPGSCRRNPGRITAMQ